MSELTHDDVQRILRIIDEMGDRDVHLRDRRIETARNARRQFVRIHGCAKSARRRETGSNRGLVRSAATAVAVEVPAGHVAIRAPTMGTFYRASSPGAKPHAEVGDRVQPDDTVGVFEVMKLFSTLKAGVAGTITAIPVSNEAMVQQDQVLVIIKPEN